LMIVSTTLSNLGPTAIDAARSAKLSRRSLSKLH
jgi:hypothetical protein